MNYRLRNFYNNYISSGYHPSHNLVTIFKMKIADIINARNPNVCWTDLVMWAMGYKEWQDIDFDGRCTRPPYFDEKWGGCYCGKHKTEEQLELERKQ